MLSSEQIMTRLILTFETVFQVLSAEKLLKDRIKCRTVPTPSRLSSSVCGISIEILEPESRHPALDCLESHSLTPTGVHQI